MSMRMKAQANADFAPRTRKLIDELRPFERMHVDHIVYSKSSM